MVEVYKHDAGKIIIGHSDKELSIGLLILNPRSSYPKHTRPVDEQLTQVYGKCSIKLYEGDRVTERILTEGEELKIAANQDHKHTNNSGYVSVTMWKFEGDITQVIDNIRKSLKRLP